MSGYKRFVSYIYGYEQGEKGGNVGFVKVNARGGECRIWVHIKGFYAHRQKPYRIYAFAPRRDRLVGQYLGELESRNGALEWDGVTAEGSLNGGFGLEESRGIYIEDGEHIFAAEWDDYPVAVENFVLPGRSARQDASGAPAKPVQTPQPPAGAEAPGSRPPQPKEPVREKPVPERPPRVPGWGASQGLPSAPLKPVETPGSGQGQPPAGQRFPREGWNRQAAEAPSLPADPRASQWQYLTKHFPVLRYQDGDGSVTGVRLGTRDLAQLPRDKWEFGNNSFLLHGFYQHRHLLLLRRQTESEAAYYVGVPGVYNEKEQMLASMFGFEEFKLMKEPQARDGSFGYWCRRL